MNELALFKSLLEDEMIDINALLIKNYKKLNINEKDIIVLSHLARQEYRGSRSFNPSRIKSKVALDKQDLEQSLEYLMAKGYIEIKVETNPKTLKEGENFYLDNLYRKIIELYIDKQVVQNESFQSQIINLYEELFNKQITPNEIEIIKMWSINKEFTFDEIKDEMMQALKLGKTNLKYVDQILVKNKIQKTESPEYKEASSIIDALKNRWKK